MSRPVIQVLGDEPSGGRPIDTEVVRPDPALLPEGGPGWTAAGLALLPPAVRAAALDRRWQVHWAVARSGGAVLGVLPLYRPITGSVPDPAMDPRALLPDLTAEWPADPATWLYVGGYHDLIAGPVVRAGLVPEEAGRVRAALAERAFDWAAGQGLRAFGLYVPDELLAAYHSAAGAGTVSRIAEEAVLPVPADGDDGYLGHLPAQHRRTVRKDWAELDRLGLRAVEGGAADLESLLPEAVELIAALRARHGTPDHPRLIAMRLRAWVRQAADGWASFAVRDQGGRLLAVSFAACHGRTAETGEIGLTEESGLRHLVYSETLVYAPLRFAQHRGCTTLRLGLGSGEPKRRRGAELRPVWAVVPGR
ncbi:hypothetical protein CFP65_5835 [Kitasatospora sp. MMS16-BH015]|uniref:GNAT family N-acetyltransferase n=1 Tax=Kitasatospora sp. MMS16-BH015 TaxID=2018025 RepID=UPI000CA33922|nr:GNAT family N-acetyltransferase [Kitasatospora sp. MMS16-BH015]AUG80517.1 hypothetical protein CFP65_5835 [Kitasatospora sp. MMS16-BH015]